MNSVINSSDISFKLFENYVEKEDHPKNLTQTSAVNIFFKDCFGNPLSPEEAEEQFENPIIKFLVEEIQKRTELSQTILELGLVALDTPKYHPDDFRHERNKKSTQLKRINMMTSLNLNPLQTFSISLNVVKSIDILLSQLVETSDEAMKVRYQKLLTAIKTA